MHELRSLIVGVVVPGMGIATSAQAVVMTMIGSVLAMLPGPLITWASPRRPP